LTIFVVIAVHITDRFGDMMVCIAYRKLGDVPAPVVEVSA
jgi:hypothetical protein